jgi:hypothetical protein
LITLDSKVESQSKMREWRSAWNKSNITRMKARDNCEQDEIMANSIVENDATMTHTINADEMKHFLNWRLNRNIIARSGCEWRLAERSPWSDQIRRSEISYAVCKTIHQEGGREFCEICRSQQFKIVRAV